MSYAITLVFEGVGEGDYRAVNEHLGVKLDGSGTWPEGLLSHVAGPTPNGWMVSEIWESKATQQRFMEDKLGKALAAANVRHPKQVIDTEPVGIYRKKL
jgi:hypothetical protein